MLRTNVAVLVMEVAMSLIFGIVEDLFLQLIVTGVGGLVGSGLVGSGLLYPQHQYEDAYSARTEDWNYANAALQGSSHLALPKALQPFSGNIGFHHIHHLAPCVPNYNLERRHYPHPLFCEEPKMTLRNSTRCLNPRFWGEANGRLVELRRMRELRRQRQNAA